MKIIISTMLLLCSAFNGFGQEVDLNFLEKNIHVSVQHKQLPHTEPHLVVNPENKDQLVAASMMYVKSGGSDRITTYYSNDGGNKWSKGKFPTDSINGVDPWLAYDKNGMVYLVYLPGYVHISSDNGKTWSMPYKISGDSNQPYDFIKISSSKNFVFISASQSLRDDNKNLVAPISIIKASKDLSEFEPPVQILPGNFDYQIGIPEVIFETDTLIIPFYELSDIKGNLLDYNRIWVTVYDGNNNKASTPRWSGFAGGSPSLVMNPKINNRLHLFWYERTDKSWTMKTSFSDDYGIHWSSSVKVEDIERSTGDYGLQPTVAINQEGIIGVIWPDHRTDSLNRAYGVYFTYSSNGGRTFNKSTLISEYITNPDSKGNKVEIGDSGRTVAVRFSVGGDYYGLVSIDADEFLALWSDNKTGIFQLWVNKIKVNK